jgi:hypothetical protein
LPIARSSGGRVGAGDGTVNREPSTVNVAAECRVTRRSAVGTEAGQQLAARQELLAEFEYVLACQRQGLTGLQHRRGPHDGGELSGGKHPPEQCSVDQPVEVVGSDPDVRWDGLSPMARSTVAFGAGDGDDGVDDLVGPLGRNPSQNVGESSRLSVLRHSWANHKSVCSSYATPSRGPNLRGGAGRHSSQDRPRARGARRDRQPLHVRRDPAEPDDSRHRA